MVSMPLSPRFSMLLIVTIFLMIDVVALFIHHVMQVFSIRCYLSA